MSLNDGYRWKLRASRMLAVASLVGLAALSMEAEAKTLYVDSATGNDATSYDANSASSPWRSVGRAAWGSADRNVQLSAQAARAGDTVIVRAGTYSAPGTDNRWDLAYNPVNSGTANAPIIFQGEGTVVLTLSSSRGPVIGAWTRNYIIWRGFTVYEAQAPTHADTGPAVLAGTTGSAIEDCILDGNGDPGFGDNHPGIRIEQARQVTVRNNRISNFRTSVVTAANGAGIQVYFSGDVLIENNEIYDSGSGIFLKAPADPNFMNFIDQFTIRYNRVARTQIGIAVHRSPNSAARPTRIYQNVVTDSGIGIRIWAFDQGASDPRNALVVNNTLYNNQEGFTVSGTLVDNAGHYFWNNLVANSTTYSVNIDGPAANVTESKLSVQHNLYWTAPRFAIVWTTNYATLSDWRTALAMDNLSPVSTVANPLFINAAGGDFHLQSSSPALSGGVDFLDLNSNGSTTDIISRGAYVSGTERIGRGNSGRAPVAPSAVQVIS